MLAFIQQDNLRHRSNFVLGSWRRRGPRRRPQCLWPSSPSSSAAAAGCPAHGKRKKPLGGGPVKEGSSTPSATPRSSESRASPKPLAARFVSLAPVHLVLCFLLIQFDCFKLSVMADSALFWVFVLQILAKAEFLSPGGSVKDRVAVKIIQEVSCSDVPFFFIFTLLVESAELYSSQFLFPS